MDATSHNQSCEDVQLQGRLLYFLTTLQGTAIPRFPPYACVN